MTRHFIRSLMTALIIACLSFLSYAQPVSASSNGPKPYKILTTGKQVTIKSSKNIQSIMVWTASGNRVVEQQDINSSSFSFTVKQGEKYVFVMIRLEGMKPFSEKIGVQ